MLTNSKIAFAAALILGTASVALAGSGNTGDPGGVNPAYHLSHTVHAPNAANAGKASALARGSYAQAHVRPGPNVASAPTGALRPLTQFEKNWFDYQNHE
jgi:hypothetical protein